METTMKSRLITILMVTLICSFLHPTSVLAADDNIYYGDTIPAGTLVDYDVVLFGVGAAWFALRNLHMNPKEKTEIITQSIVEKSKKSNNKKHLELTFWWEQMIYQGFLY